MVLLESTSLGAAASLLRLTSLPRKKCLERGLSSIAALAMNLHRSSEVIAMESSRSLAERVAGKGSNRNFLQQLTLSPPGYHTIVDREVVDPGRSCTSALEQ